MAEQTWRQLLTEANKKANAASAIYADESGNYDEADRLMAEAKDIKARAVGIRDVEENYQTEAPPAPGLTTTKAQKARENLLAAGWDEGQVQQMLAAVSQQNVPNPVKTTEPTTNDVKFGEFLKAVRLKDARALAAMGSKAESDPEVKDLLEGTGASGGYLVPTQVLNELMMVPDSDVVVRPRARKIPMNRRSIQYPMLDQDGTPSAYWDLQYFGGVYAVWTEEAGSKTEVEPAFKQGELVAHKLAGYTQASDELLDDSATALAAFLAEMFRGAVAMREDFAFLRGTGVGMPLGIINSGALVTQNRATANTISYNDLTRMVENMLPSSFGNAVWLLDLTALGAVLRITDAGSNAAFIVNANGGVTQRIPGTIFGRPVIVTEKLPALGSTGDLMLVDFRYYLIGDRQATTIAASEHYAFTNDLTTWRFVHRVDGQPWLDAPIYIDTSNTVSPFVALHANTTS